MIWDMLIAAGVTGLLMLCAMTLFNLAEKFMEDKPVWVGHVTIVAVAVILLALLFIIVQVGMSLR